MVQVVCFTIRRGTRNTAARFFSRETHFGGDDGKVCGAWRVSFEHHMADAGIPDACQVIRAFARDHNEAFRLAFQITKILSLIAIDYDHTIQSEVWVLYDVDPMRSVPQ